VAPVSRGSFVMSGRYPCLASIRNALAAVAVALDDLLDHEVHEPVPPGVPLLRLGRANLGIKAVNERGQLVFELSNVMSHRIDCVNYSLDLW
jgi:hypothetical protein